MYLAHWAANRAFLSTKRSCVTSLECCMRLALFKLVLCNTHLTLWFPLLKGKTLPYDLLKISKPWHLTLGHCFCSHIRRAAQQECCRYACRISEQHDHWNTECQGFEISRDLVIGILPFKTLRPIQDGRHFADDIFKCIFLNENTWISGNISLKFVPKGQINNIPALVRQAGDKLLSEPIIVSLLRHVYVNRPQWVNK